MLYRGKVAGLFVVSTAVMVRSCLSYFLQRRLKVLNQGYSASYMILICINDMIILIGYSICLCLIVGALKRLDRLLNDEAFWGGQGMCKRAATMHLVVFLLFLCSQLFFSFVNYATVIKIAVSHRGTKMTFKDALMFEVAWCIKLCGVFLGSLILLGMFWRYTLL